MSILPRAALVACLGAGTAACGGGGADLQALHERLERLDARVDRAEAIRAVKRLQHAYGQYSEVGLWHDLADLFADAAVGHYPAGVLTGKASIHDLFFDEVGQGRLGLADGRLYPHIVLQPIVTLAPDGLTAHGRWHVLALLGGYGAGATWVGGLYENDYVKDEGVWKIHTLRYYTQFTGRYDNPEWSAPEWTFQTDLDAARIGAPAGDGEAPSAAARPASPDLASLAVRLGAIESRVRRLQAEADVRNLQHSYGYYTDRKMWDDVADLFADGGTLELGRRGVYVGRSSIRRALDLFGPAGLRDGEINDHLQLQTIVTVAPDGVTAWARGSELSLTGTPETGGRWGNAIFENRYVNDAGVWRVASMRVHPRMITDFDKGWAADAQPAPGPSQERPPDRPPTEAYAIYPAFHLAALHFDHPVTGRPAQYPEGVAAPRAASAVAPPAEPASAAATVAELEAKLAGGEFEARLASAERAADAAEAYDAAENLASAYGYAIDESLWPSVADLFAREGWHELPGAGVYVGRERIRESLTRALGAGGGRTADAFAVHHVTQPVIHVAPDGRSARLRVRLLEVRGQAGAPAAWLAGVFENDAVKEDGVWRLQSVDPDFTWTITHGTPWARIADRDRADSAPPAASDFPPDRPPRGPAGVPFPAIEAMGFHYTNPVTGREPARLIP